MAEFRLHLELERASGVLASIVARLAQQGLELKSQKLERASEGRGGTLDIVAEGDNEDIASLARNMAAARGVGRVVRIQRDNEAVFAKGAVIEPAADPDKGTTSPAFAADDNSVHAELDAFLDPDAGGKPEASEQSRPAVRQDAEWLEEDPEADQGPALYPDKADDDLVEPPVLGRVDEPEPEPDPDPEPEKEPTPDIEPSGWGQDAEDEWADELSDGTEPAPEPEMDMLTDFDEDRKPSEAQSTPEGPESEVENEAESELEPDSNANAESSTEPESRPAPAPDPADKEKAGIESTIRRRRRRRR